MLFTPTVIGGFKFDKNEKAPDFTISEWRSQNDDLPDTKGQVSS